MSNNGSGYRPVVERIGADLIRIDAGEPPAPFVASALRTIAQAQDDHLSSAMGELNQLSADVKVMKRTLNAILVAMLPFTGALIYFGQQATA